MPKPDPYCDYVLGEWSFNDKLSKKKENKGKKLVFTRKGEFKLHKDHAIERVDPESFKKQRVHGKVVLTETKLVDMQNSAVSLFRGLELTPESVIVDVIPAN